MAYCTALGYCPEHAHPESPRGLCLMHQALLVWDIDNVALTQQQVNQMVYWVEQLPEHVQQGFLEGMV